MTKATTPKETRLIRAYRQLSPDDQKRIVERLEADAKAAGKLG